LGIYNLSKKRAFLAATLLDFSPEIPLWLQNLPRFAQIRFIFSSEDNSPTGSKAVLSELCLLIISQAIIFEYLFN
jgi:hypothetical protein